MFSYLQNKVSLPTLESFSRATANYTIKVILGLRESELDMLFDELKIPALDRSAIRLVLKDLEQTHPDVGGSEMTTNGSITVGFIPTKPTTQLTAAQSKGMMVLTKRRAPSHKQQKPSKRMRLGNYEINQPDF